MKRRMERIRALSREPWTGDTRMEIDGNRRVILDGKCRIAEYEEDCIRLETAHGNICFRGRELRLTDFERQATTVTGRLMSIEFE